MSCSFSMSWYVEILYIRKNNEKKMLEMTAVSLFWSLMILETVILKYECFKRRRNEFTLIFQYYPVCFYFIFFNFMFEHVLHDIATVSSYVQRYMGPVANLLNYQDSVEELLSLTRCTGRPQS